LTTKNKESTWQLECDPAVAVDLTRESLDLETDSVVRMPYTGPEVHSSTLLECRKKSLHGKSYSNIQDLHYWLSDEKGN